MRNFENRRGLFSHFKKISAAMLCSLMIFAVGCEKSQEAKKEPRFAIYVKDGEMHFTELDKIEPKEITSNAVLGLTSEEYEYHPLDSVLTKVSADGKKIIYPDDFVKKDFLEYTLYYREIGEKGLSEPVEIGENLYSYKGGKDFNDIYFIEQDSDRLSHLTMADKKTENISKNVFEFMASDDGKRIIYQMENQRAYFKEVGKEREKLADDYIFVAYNTDDLSTFYYIVGDRLFKKEIGKEKELVLEGFEQILKVFPSGEIYYTTEETMEFNASDYIEDDMVESDKKLEYVKAPEFPNREHFKSDAEYEKAYEEYERLMKLERAFSMRTIRDELRHKVENKEKITVPNYTLHYFDGKESKLISKNIMKWSVRYAYYPLFEQDKTAFAFGSFSEPGENKIKLSDIVIDYYELEGLIDFIHAKATKHYIAIGDTVSNPIVLKDGLEMEELSPSFVFTKKTDKVFFTDETRDDGRVQNLYSIDINGKEIGEPKLYAEGISAYSHNILEDGSVTYSKYLSEKESVLYRNQEKLIEDGFAYHYNHRNGKIDFLVVKNVDYDTRIQDVFLYSEGKLHEVGEKLSENILLTQSGDVLYLKDYDQDSQKGDLYLFVKDGEDIKIDEGVFKIMDPNLSENDLAG
ncbi:MAG: hypothetical protein Q4D65_05480 [Peptostreptococcaceae bacterium]|nr:hypothetical protein [Peptostreptococcaceae bacterium]